MAIKHTFVSAKSDGADDTLVRPSNWNADHTIENDSISYAQIQNVSGTDKLLGRSSAGAGDIEEITCTSFGRNLLDDADATAGRTTLGLGSLATQSGTFSGTSSGTNTGDQNLFSTIAVAGQSNVVADSTSDTLTLAAGSNITLTTDASTDTITIAASTSGPSGSGTTNELAYWTGATSLGTLATATYPSLTELSYVKGVTSAIQTQLNAKLSANQTITLSGDVTGSGSTAITTAIGAGKVTNAMLAGSIALTKLTGDTTTALGIGTVELGHASDTTLSRSAAGRLAVEGVNVVTISSTDTLTNKTLTTPTLSGTASGTTAGRLGYNSGVLSFGNGSAQQSVTTGTGTANRIAYWSGTNTVTSNANFLFDGTNMTVGTNSASGKLYVFSSSTTASSTQTNLNALAVGNADGITNYGIKALARCDAGNTANLYMTHIGVYAEAAERTGTSNAGSGAAVYGLYAKSSGKGSNLTKFGAYVDALDGAAAFSTVTGTNYGIVSTGGLNVLHCITEQLRIAYDSSNYVNFTVGSSGTATINGAGTDKGFAFASGFKLGFFGATAIVQPTTGVAASAFTANSGTAVNDASTFDGYTIKQVVKALRNLGLLA